MKEFDKWFINEPADFHLWTQQKQMRFAWKAALEWAVDQVYMADAIQEELHNGDS